MKTPSTNDLINLAEAAGVTITWHKGGPQGAWIPHRHQISIRHGMDDTTTRSVLAHELAHMALGHPPCANAQQEKRADQFAARLLISTVDYRLAEEMFDANQQQIAAELGVTLDLLSAWREYRSTRANA